MPEKNFLPGENYDYPLIIKKLLNTPMIYSPNQEIIYRDKMRYTYKTLEERINRLADSLTNMGVNFGDTVAVFDYDSHRYLECFFAIPMMGAVLQTINWRLSADQVIYTINHAEAKLIIINSDFLPILEDIRDQLENVQKIIVISEEGGTPDTKLEFAGEYEKILESAAVSYDFPDMDENTKATTFYTTGTTGLPKGVYFSHRQLVLHTFSTAIALGSYHTIGRLRSDDVYMPITPMFHVHAWGIPYVATLLGVKQIYPGKYEPAMLLKLIVSEKVTFSHCVPTILQMLVNSPAVKEIDFSGWKVIIGGSRLPKGLAKAARDMGIDVYTGYGMSETCPVISLGVPKADMLDWEDEKILDIVIKTGLPIPLAEIQIVDPDDKPLPHDGVSTGEVTLRSPWLTNSYFKADDKTKELWRRGWLYTGDVGYIGEDGYLQITDRIKDVIKSGGEWVSSLDLENMISQHEAVMESAAIGVPDEKWGERPLMLVVLKPEYAGKVTAEDFKEHMKKFADQGKLPKYGVPDRYEIVDEIAKTSVGKINKKVLREERK
ncbi:MAG: fatty acid--CoA ligase [Desulfobacteraceae bacterium]|nr:fatty acid--CoA ligase [Desulfobacteraceae bacterium]